MRLYTQPHRFYCGIDLHARTLFLHVLDHDGQTRFEKNIPARPAAFLEAVQPFRDGLIVGVECMFAWYWLADLCPPRASPSSWATPSTCHDPRRQVEDRQDRRRQDRRPAPRRTVPASLRLPQGPTRDPRPARRRTFLVRQRAQFLTHVVNTNSQYNLPAFPAKLSYKANRSNIDEIVDRLPHESVRHSIRADLAMIDALDAQVDSLESYLTRAAKIDDPVTYHLLRTVPGIGKVIALILLYEVQDIRRFEHAGNFLSYSRLVRCRHESAGKIKAPAAPRSATPTCVGPSARRPA